MPNTNATPEKEVKQPLLGNTAYDFAKDATTIYIPALAAAYAGVAVILNLPFSVEVVGVAGVLVTFLGTVLKISSNRFQNQPVAYDGQLVVNMTDPLKENYKLEIGEPWDELAKNDEVRIRVVDESAPEDPLHTSGL